MRPYSSFNKNIISIDLGSFEIKMIEAKENKNGIQVNKAFSFKTPPGSYQNGYIKDFGTLAAMIKEELKDNKFHSGFCHMSIKSSAIISREVSFPAVSDAEIEGLLKYQLSEYLPMDASKYIVQHRIIGSSLDESKDKLVVMVVAIPKEIVDAHYNFLIALGVKPAILDYQSNSLWKLMNFTDYINRSITVRDKTIAIVDLGYSSTNITITKNGVLNTSRVIEIGGMHLDDHSEDLVAASAEDDSTESFLLEETSNKNKFLDQSKYSRMVDTSVEGLMDRIEKVFKYYISKDMGNEIDQILIYGGAARIQGIEKTFTNYLNIPAALINGVGRVNIQDEPGKYLNCISAILRDDGV